MPFSSPAVQQGLPKGLSQFEFVAMIASLMAVNALGIDIMLPAMADIGRDLHIAGTNDQQWIIAAFMLGYGGAQFIYGPLADRYGRKIVLSITITLYAAASLGAALSPDFPTILMARFLMGSMSASTRILAMTIVRDRFAGPQMARIVSLALMVFFTVPILAPSIGQTIMGFAGWRAIFVFLAAYSLCVVGWIQWRMPETLHPQYRRPIAMRVIGRGFWATTTNRYSIGYTLAVGIIMGAFFAYLNSAQQIFIDVFHEERHFPKLFALGALGMISSALVNSRLVERFGTRRMSHSALLSFIAITGLHGLIALSGHETLWVFIVMQFLTLACYSMVTSNFNVMALEPMGELAGTAASAQGFIITVTAALIGVAVSSQFNGTATPLILSFFMLGVISLAMVLWTERGRLFHSHHGHIPVEHG